MATFITGNAQHQAAADDSYLTIFRFTDNRAPNGSTLTRVTCFFHSVAGSTGMVKRFTANTDGTFNVRDIEDFTVPAVASLPYEQPFEVVCSDLVPSTGDHYYGIYLDDPAEAPLDLVASTAENYCLASEATGNSVDFGIAVTGDYQIECRFELALEPQPISNCTGRVGSIIDKVIARSNDYKMDMAVPSEIIDSIVDCMREIAKKGYWKKTTTVTLIAGTGDYDLLDEVEDVEEVLEIRQTTDSLTQSYIVLHTRSDFEYKKNQYISGYRLRADIAGWALIEDNTLTLYPVPDGTVASIAVDHTYCPEDVDCLSNTTPRIPKAHDAIFMHFALRELADKDHGRDNWQQLYQLHDGRYQRALMDLMAQSVTGDFAIEA